MYKLSFTKQAQKALLKAPTSIAQSIRQKLERLAENPYAPNPNAKKLQNREGYRLRVGDWRVIYDIQNDAVVILVLKISQRGDIYR